MSFVKESTVETRPADSISDDMFQDIDNLKPGEGWVMLYYGASGSGKTHFCGTAGPRTLFINIGNGIETLLSPLFKHMHPEFFARNGKPGALVVNLNEKFGIDGTIQVATGFNHLCKVIDRAMAKPDIRERFDTICIDDATSLRRFALNRAVEIQDQPASRTKRKLDKYVLTDMSDKGREIDMINWFLAQYVPVFKEQGINLVMTAHERQIFGPTAKMGEARPLIAIKPGFTGQTFPDDVPAHFDEVWRADPISTAQGPIFRCWTQPNGSEIRKTRHGGIFLNLEQNPNFTNMLARIRKGEMHPDYFGRSAGSTAGLFK